MPPSNIPLKITECRTLEINGTHQQKCCFDFSDPTTCSNTKVIDMTHTFQNYGPNHKGLKFNNGVPKVRKANNFFRTDILIVVLFFVIVVAVIYFLWNKRRRDREMEEMRRHEVEIGQERSGEDDDYQVHQEQDRHLDQNRQLDGYQVNPHSQYRVGSIASLPSDRQSRASSILQDNGQAEFVDGRDN